MNKSERAGLSVMGFYRQLDAALAATATRAHDCKAGCSYCCHIQVVAQPHEVFHLATFMHEHFAPERIRFVRDRARANRNRIDTLTVAEHRATNIPCPLLEDGKCSAYPARPATCRSFHSLNVKVCEAAYFDTNYSAPHPYDVPVLRQSVEFQRAITQAVAQQGFDVDRYEFNGALIEALSNADSRKRWQNGKRAFSSKYMMTE